MVDRVMDRIAAAPASAAPLWALWPEPELPWWVRLVSQPSVWLSLLLVALVITWGDRLSATAAGLAHSAAEQVTRLTAVSGEPNSILVLLLPLVIVMGLVSLGFYWLSSVGMRRLG
jgi:hypothetical protein